MEAKAVRRGWRRVSSMTAKEMFEELGFNEEEDNRTIITYENRNSIIWSYVYFYEDKTIELDTVSNYKVYKAINKQIEELGWLE